MPPFGEFLVKQGLVTTQQLEVALEIQTLYGGRLGFNLVDLGFLTVQKLTTALGEFHGVETTDGRELKRISWDVLKLVPSEIAIKYKLLPVSLDRNRLTIVMSDPTDMTAINEVGFVTGCVIRIRIAPDFVIKRTLEEYYENVSFREFIRPLHAQEIQKIKERAMARTPSPPPARVEGGGTPPSPSRAPATAPAAPQAAQAEVVAVPVAGRAVEAPPARDVEKTPYQKVSWRFGNAQTREDIGRALVDYSTIYLKRAALVTLRNDRIEGWLGFGEGVAPQTLRKLDIPIQSVPCVGDLLSTLKYHVVELGASAGEQALIQALGGTRPRSLLLFPLVVRGKPVCILCGDNGPSEGAVSKALWADFAEFEKVIHKAQVAFEMIVMKWWLIQG